MSQRKFKQNQYKNENLKADAIYGIFDNSIFILKYISLKFNYMHCVCMWETEAEKETTETVTDTVWMP